MTDHGAKLARMANQIADFFRSYPEDAAIAGVREHIVAFWSPRMRKDLDTLVAASSPLLDPLVVAACRTHPTEESPTHREVAGPDAVGQLASDAG